MTRWDELSDGQRDDLSDDELDALDTSCRFCGSDLPGICCVDELARRSAAIAEYQAMDAIGELDETRREIFVSLVREAAESVGLSPDLADKLAPR